MMLIALSVTVISVVVVLTLMQQKATKRSFSEQLSTLVDFSVDIVQLGLSTGQMRAVKEALGRLENYSIFEGAILFDEDLTPLLTMPEDFELPQSLIDRVIKSGKEIQGEISYEAGILKDEDGETIGTLLIAFTLAPVKAEAGRGLIYASVSGFFILLPIIGLTMLQITKMIKPLEQTVEVLEAVAEGDLSQRLDISTKDEAGQLAEAFRKMIVAQKAKAVVADEISRGNLAVEVKAVSDKDMLGKAMVTMKESLRAMQADLQATIDSQKAGDLDARCHPEKFRGTYAELLGGINDSLNAVIEPLAEGVEILQEYAKGDLTRQMRKLPGQQIVLTEAMNTIRNNLQALIDEGVMLAKAADEGRLGLRGDTSKFEGGYREIIQGMNNTVENILNPVNDAVGCLAKMAEGDFTIAITGDYQGDHAVMKDAMNSTLAALNDILGQVSVAVEQVASGSKQVSDSGQALSDGASQQASSLEEITSSMTEIGAQTKQNAENATQANQLSGAARDNAEDGNKQMKKMLSAMGEINKSSHEISKIIKVIDEIAFQTNLLALNAAVEAARAGVHGKGFAVVAEEVRNLAQRSAKAAQETTQLIEDSVKTVDNGTNTANATAKSLNEIVHGVTKVTDLVQEIAVASNEQAQGIAQVNSGLGQIEHVTEANAANAQESASVSQELFSYAAQLKQMLSQFKLRNQGISDFNSDFSTSAVTVVDEAVNSVDEQDAWGGADKLKQIKDAQGKSSGFIALDDDDLGKY